MTALLRPRAGARAAAGSARADASVAPVDLLLVRAALHAGATPAQALTAVPDRGGPLAIITRRLVAGADLQVLAADPACPAGPLVRGLAAAEVAGAAAVPVLDGLIDAVVRAAELDRLVHTRSAQARLVARMLTALPVVGATGIALLDTGARTFLASPGGAVLMATAGLLVLLASWWMRHLVSGVGRAVLLVDPLVEAPHRVLRPGRGALDRSGADGLLPTVEALQLLAVSLAAGVPLAEAMDLVSRLGPPGVRRPLRRAADGLRAGLPPADAFPRGLQEAADVIDVSGRWGAPAVASLRLLADDLGRRATAASEAAAEQLSVRLVFPTTLLLVPAFGLLVVAPLVASALAGLDLGL